MTTYFPNLTCDDCGDTFDDTDFVDVFTRPDGTTVCERCLPADHEPQEDPQ